jgi:DNA repair and recombination protein RAD52
VPSDPDSHPDEVVLPAPAPATSHHVNGGPSKQLRPAAPNGQPMPASTRFGNGNNSTGRPGPPHPHALPQTPNNGFQRSTSVGGMQGRLPQGVTALQAPVIQGRILHQPNRPAPLSAPPSPNHPKTSSDEDGDLRQLQPPVGGSVGFFSARAAINSNLEGPEPPQAVKNLPAFDPRAESPSIRRTAGIDHQTSKPLTKNLEHIAVASQVHSPTGVPAHMRPSLMNPSMDNTRRIGAPQSPGSMGMGNRGAYKAPTILKRVNDNSHSNGNDGGTSAGHGQQGMRPPLGDISGQGNLPSADVGGDIKRQRLNGL